MRAMPLRTSRGRWRATRDSRTPTSTLRWRGSDSASDRALGHIGRSTSNSSLPARGPTLPGSICRERAGESAKRECVREAQGARRRERGAQAPRSTGANADAEAAADADADADADAGAVAADGAHSVHLPQQLEERGPHAIELRQDLGVD